MWYKLHYLATITLSFIDKNNTAFHINSENATTPTAEKPHSKMPHLQRATVTAHNKHHTPTGHSQPLQPGWAAGRALAAVIGWYLFYCWHCSGCLLVDCVVYRFYKGFIFNVLLHFSVNTIALVCQHQQ
jgi:hypothetical protein